jgi:antitoxin component YwqK of YwqJK toxin-antitoxin module
MHPQSITYEDGSRYTGDLVGITLKNICHGSGQFFTSASKLRYDGQWSNNKCHGYGSYFRDNGTILYSGYWSNNQMDGAGTKYDIKGNAMCKGVWKSGKVTELQFLNIQKGQEFKISYYKDHIYLGSHIDQQSPSKNLRTPVKSGEGYLYDYCGNILYHGNFSNDKKSNSGESYLNDRVLEYKGSYLNDLHDGPGVLYDYTAKVKFDGFFRKGKILQGNWFYATGEKYFEGSYDLNG